MPAQAALVASGGVPELLFSPSAVCQARRGIVSLLTRPNKDSDIDTEVLFGERVTVLSCGKKWMRVRAHLDHKEGYVEARHFSDKTHIPTHRVCVPLVATTKARAVQGPVYQELGMNALVRVTHSPVGDKFSRILHGGWVNNACIVPVNEFEQDFVEVACRFVRTPYFWGARTGMRIDCSALVQAALVACGHHCPRDSGQQSKALGYPIDRGEGLQRGDLIFWKGHVGIMVNRTHLLHASDNTMMTVIEPLQRVIDRRHAEEPEDKKSVTVIRRLPWYMGAQRRRL